MCVCAEKERRRDSPEPSQKCYSFTYLIIQTELGIITVACHLSEQRQPGEKITENPHFPLKDL